jgi:hypothetical protein
MEDAFGAVEAASDAGSSDCLPVNNFSLELLKITLTKTGGKA